MSISKQTLKSKLALYLHYSKTLKTKLAIYLHCSKTLKSNSIKSTIVSPNMTILLSQNA